MQNFVWKHNSRKFADCSLKNFLMSYAYKSHRKANIRMLSPLSNMIICVFSNNMISAFFQTHFSVYCICV